MSSADLELEDDDELVGYGEDGAPRVMTLANAIQCWSIGEINAGRKRTTVGDAAMMFNVTPARVREAVEAHYWMFLGGEDGDSIEHEGK